ncbi:MAG: transposase [Candidatus Schekmanbacteria bacterium]|nr:transposase [Candidatus Schekmanbacteria bacterium]
MAKSRGPSFILELDLATTAKDDEKLYKRVEQAGRNLYNACLGEALRRLQLRNQSRDFQRIRRLPKGPERTAAFKKLNAKFCFTEYDLHAFAGSIKSSCWIGDHLDINTVQKIATRAYDAVEQLAFGQRGRPRFKRAGEMLSVEGKSNKQGIRYRHGRIEWLGLSIPCRFDPDDPVVAYGLEQRLKFCRVLHRTIRGRRRWYVQLVLEGRPYQKPANAAGKDVVGLDLGPSTIAAVDDSHATLETFCVELKSKQAEIRRIQRAMDRSRRATNPANYKADGTAKKGSRKWIRSRRYARAQARKADLERRAAAHRKSLHGRLANCLIRRGKVLRSEKVPYKAWQKRWGKSIGRRAPSLFVAMLARKAAAVGGRLEDIATRKTRLSQTCICGRIKKKTLGERTHRCECGVEAQRDLMSAYLARHVDHNLLNADQAHDGWSSVESLLRAALSTYQAAKQSTASCSRPSGVGRTGQSGLPAKAERMAVKIGRSTNRKVCKDRDLVAGHCLQGPAGKSDVVAPGPSAGCESPEKAKSFAHADGPTPWWRYVQKVLPFRTPRL